MPAARPGLAGRVAARQGAEGCRRRGRQDAGGQACGSLRSIRGTAVPQPAASGVSGWLLDRPLATRSGHSHPVFAINRAEALPPSPSPG